MGFVTWTVSYVGCGCLTCDSVGFCFTLLDDGLLYGVLCCFLGMLSFVAWICLVFMVCMLYVCILTLIVDASLRGFYCVLLGFGWFINDLVSRVVCNCI